MELSKAVETIEKISHAGLILPPEPDIDALVSAEALMRVLTARGKDVGLLSAPSREIEAQKNVFRALASTAGLARELIISIDTAVSPLSQLRYETTDTHTDIILSPKSYSVQRSAISYRDGNIHCDCIIALGVGRADLDDPACLGIGNDLPSESPLITINTTDAPDTVPPDTREGGIFDAVHDLADALNPLRERRALHSDAIRLGDRTISSLSEITYSLVSDLPDMTLDRETATLLFAGILAKTDRFRSAQTSSATLLTASGLLHAGASQQEAFSIISRTRSVSFLQLAGRASVRSKVDRERNILWSFLTKEDFAKTERSPKDASPLLAYIEQEFPPHRISVLLWQDPLKEYIKALMAGDHDVLMQISGRTRAAFRSPHLEIETNFPSFPEAENRISTLLAEAL